MSELRYVVRRLNWKSPIAGRYVRLPGWTEVAAFDAAETADADRRRREQEVRTAVNPFACAGSFFEMSSLPGPVLSDWLMDGGLEPPSPAAPFREWRAWWDAAAGSMTAAEWAHAWAGFGAAFGPMIVLALTWRRMTGAGAVAGLVVGAAVVIAWIALGWDKAFLGGPGVYEILPGFVLSWLAIVLVSSMGAPDTVPEPAPTIH